MKKQMGWTLTAGILGVFLMSAVPARAADAPVATTDKTIASSATDKPVVTQKKHKAAKKTGVKSKREHTSKKY